MKICKPVALIVVISIALSTSVFASGPVTVQLPFPVSDVWKRAVQAFALEHITITNSNEGAGILQGSGSFADQPGLFSCEKGAGILYKEEYNVTVVVNPSGDSVTTVSVQTEAKTTWLRHHRIFFIRGKNHLKYVTCTSTGELEKFFLQLLSAP